jgi:hypothetical protein
VEVNVGPSQGKERKEGRKEGNMRVIYGPCNDNIIWRTRYSNELDMLYDELDIVKVIKIGKLR